MLTSGSGGHRWWGRGEVAGERLGSCLERVGLSDVEG